MNAWAKKYRSWLANKSIQKLFHIFPICKNCGRLYVANAEQYIPDDKKIVYTCSAAELANKRLKAVDSKVEADIRKGEGKTSLES